MSIRRCITAFLLSFLAFAAHAASLGDRSPFTQGHWWDSSRSGNGFEIFNTSDQVMVIWYTYDDGGRPIWYTAQGAKSTLGTTQAWQLLKHRWSGGRHGGYDVVGSLRLDVKHPEAIDIAWEVNGKRGTWAAQPFILSGTVSEVDHTGSWFNPDNSGWGFTFTEQGEVIGGVLFTYDTAGAPTWVAGFERGAASVELYATQGACPSCPYAPTATRSVGRLGIEFEGEMRMALRSGGLALPMAAGVNIDGAKVAQLGRPASTRPADRQLASFQTEAALKSYLDTGLFNIMPYGGFDFSPAPPSATAFSLTNLQEAGVDESDLVKSNGRYIYTYAHAGNTRLPAVRIARVGAEGAELDMRATVQLLGGASLSMSNSGLFLTDDKLVSVTGSLAYSVMGSPWISPTAWTSGRSAIEVMSLANPELPQTVWRAELDGYIVASRRIGDRVYVVSRFAPTVVGFIYGNSNPATVATNQALLANTPLSALLPKVRVNGGEPTPLVEASSVYAPPQGARKPMADLLVVTAIDLTAPRIAQTLAIVGQTEAVYVSTGNLFVASSRYDQHTPLGQLLPEPGIYMTDVHQIRIESAAMRIVGSGTVEGYLGIDPDKAPFRMSEHEGRFRIVTGSQMWGPTKNRLTVVEPSTVTPGLLKTVSYLPNAQRPQTLGKPNELLYGTRFMGDRLYAVTFKKVDPLYIVDLSNAADPRIAGELEIPGFSDYLHPLPNGLLLGFGKDARPATTTGDAQFAWYQGLQLTLFDVAGSQPRELQRVLMGKRGSESALLHHHHAFSSLKLSDNLTTIGIPARIADGAVMYPNGDASTYAWQESGLMRFELRGSTPADAQLVRMPSLITHRSIAPADYPPLSDAAGYGARSILFRNGTIYVGNGLLWRQDIGGNVYGPL